MRETCPPPDKHTQLLLQRFFCSNDRPQKRLPILTDGGHSSVTQNQDRSLTTRKGHKMGAAELMKRAVEAWGEADHRLVFEILDEQVIWRSAATFRGNLFRFGEIYRGRDAVIAHLSKLSTAYFFTNCTTKEIVSTGEVAWGLFDISGNYLPEGRDRQARPLRFDCAMRWRFGSEKLLDAQTFFDTVALLAQQGELPHAPASSR